MTSNRFKRYISPGCRERVTSTALFNCPDFPTLQMCAAVIRCAFVETLVYFAILPRSVAIVDANRWDEFCTAHSATTINENGVPPGRALAQRTVASS
jgi:hypothetical protein